MSLGQRQSCRVRNQTEKAKESECEVFKNNTEESANRMDEKHSNKNIKAESKAVGSEDEISQLLSLTMTTPDPADKSKLLDTSMYSQIIHFNPEITMTSTQTEEKYHECIEMDINKCYECNSQEQQIECSFCKMLKCLKCEGYSQKIPGDLIKIIQDLISNEEKHGLKWQCKGCFKEEEERESYTYLQMRNEALEESGKVKAKEMAYKNKEIEDMEEKLTRMSKKQNNATDIKLEEMKEKVKKTTSENVKLKKEVTKLEDSNKEIRTMKIKQEEENIKLEEQLVMKNAMEEILKKENAKLKVTIEERDEPNSANKGAISKILTNPPRDEKKSPEEKEEKGSETATGGAAAVIKTDENQSEEKTEVHEKEEEKDSEEKDSEEKDSEEKIDRKCWFQRQCRNGRECRFTHHDKKIDCIYYDYGNGHCKNGNNCWYRHENNPTEERKPAKCRYEETKGQCSNQWCTFKHEKTRARRVPTMHYNQRTSYYNRQPYENRYSENRYQNQYQGRQQGQHFLLNIAQRAAEEAVKQLLNQ